METELGTGFSTLGRDSAAHVGASLPPRESRNGFSACSKNIEFVEHGGCDYLNVLVVQSAQCTQLVVHTNEISGSCFLRTWYFPEGTHLRKWS